MIPLQHHTTNDTHKLYVTSNTRHSSSAARFDSWLGHRLSSLGVTAVFHTPLNGISGYYLKIGHGIFPQNTFQFIIHVDHESRTVYLTKLQIKTKLRAFGPRANYADRATAPCWRSCQLLRIDGVAWSEQRIPTVVNLDFLDRSRYFLFQVAPQLSSRG
jgi:hypothetical protein